MLRPGPKDGESRNLRVLGKVTIAQSCASPESCEAFGEAG